MKELIIINSTLGGGKSTVSKELCSKLDNSVLIHGDDLSSQIKDFSVYDRNALLQCIELIAEQVNRHETKDYIIVDYVFEEPSEVQHLTSKIKLNTFISVFYLEDSLNSIRDKILARNNPNKDWELRRSEEILTKQESFFQKNQLGKMINTNNQSAVEVANRILSFLHKTID